MASLTEGHPTEHAVCAGLAHRFDVATAAVITLDPLQHTATITAWPRGVDILGMKLVLDRLPQAFPLLMRHLLVDRRPSCLSRDADPSSWHGTVAALLLHEVLACEDIAQLPLADDGRRVRLAVLATHAAYDERALHALAQLCDPLAAVIELLERSIPRDPPREARASHTRKAVDAAPPASSLTARELEVLRMVAEGMLARTIAARLRVSPRTVHKHLGNAYRKLDAHDRLVAVRRAERLGLLTSGAPPDAPDPRTTGGTVVPAPAPPREDALTLRW